MVGDVGAVEVVAVAAVECVVLVRGTVDAGDDDLRAGVLEEDFRVTDDGLDFGDESEPLALETRVFVFHDPTVAGLG